MPLEKKDIHNSQGNMTSMQQTGNHCWSRVDKAYTNFTWSLDEWSLLYDYYTTILSPEFEIPKMNGKTCAMSIRYEKGYGASIIFPGGMGFRAINATLSVIDGKLVKQSTTRATFRNSQKNCVVYFYPTLHSVPDTWLVNGTLTLFLELTIVIPIKASTLRTEILDTDFSTDMCKNCKVILDSKDLCDVTFVVGGKKLYAHKLILAANSEVFRAMFTTQMEELKNNTVEIVDTDATVFEAFLCYMYTGRVSEIDNVIDELIVVADKYQVMNLKKHCERYMSNHINDHTVITYLLKAHLLSCAELQEKCIDFIKVNTHILGNFSDFSKLYEHPTILIRVFQKEPTA